MMERSSHLCAIAALAALALMSCASSKKPHAITPSQGVQQMLQAARDSANAAMKETSHGEIKELTRRGVEYSERCLMAAPREPGCYYWRAVNTGLYHRIHVIGYQRGVKRMIEDCQKVIGLDPRYDHAGAYRILGQIYTRLPSTGGTADSIVRDLPKAEGYLRLAAGLAQDYPENHIALAETLYEEDKIAEAQAALAGAKRLAPRWKHDASYDGWRAAILALEKKMKRINK